MLGGQCHFTSQLRLPYHRHDIVDNFCAQICDKVDDSWDVCRSREGNIHLLILLDYEETHIIELDWQWKSSIRRVTSLFQYLPKTFNQFQIAIILHMSSIIFCDLSLFFFASNVFQWAHLMNPCSVLLTLGQQTCVVGSGYLWNDFWPQSNILILQV